MDNTDLPSIDHKQPPTTVREVGIHLIYMSKNMSDINKKLDEMASSYASNEALVSAINERRKDMNTLCDKVIAVENRVTALEKLYDSIVSRIAGWAIGIVVVALFIYTGLEEFIK